VTAPSQTSSAGALEAVRELESALEERNEAHDLDRALDAAREEAERLLAAARRSGIDAGRRRGTTVLAQAAADAAAIRAAGDAHAREVLDRVAGARNELVAELTALLLPRER
jgi:hypothetical protein